MAACVLRSQELAAEAAASPAAGSHPATYWNENNVLRWTNAVAAFDAVDRPAVRVEAATDARAGAAARASTAVRSVSMPALDSGAVT